MRPALAAVAAQQKIIDAQSRAILAIASAAGISQHRDFVALRRMANIDENPAQPDGWATSPSGTESAAETTDGARQPDGTDDVAAIGASSVSDVAPMTTTDVEAVGGVVDAPLDLNEQDVTAPVAGTENLGKGAPGEAGTNRVETEVVVGTPDQTPAFDDGSFSTQASQERLIASLRLARLQIEAGISQGDDLLLSQKIAASGASDAVIADRISTLAAVTATKAASVRSAARNLVPRSASAERSVPSLSAEASFTPATNSSAFTDEIAFE